MLNEYILQADKSYMITASAFTQARKKLKHTAFIELNEDIITSYYENNDFKKLYGFRMLAFDGSKIILPNSQEIKDEYGTINIGNHTGKELGDYTRATFECCYDVLNNIAVKSMLDSGRGYEVDLATKMLNALNKNDLLIFDRAYASYLFLASLIKKGLNFVVRCPQSSFVAVNNMFDADSPSSFTALISVPNKFRKEAKKLGLPTEVKVRLVKVILSRGEIEVLATSLVDEKLFAENIFKEIYGLRWGVETFFSKIKGRLCLENFTGKSTEAVKQDFWATIFISNLETVMTEDVEQEINNDLKAEQQERFINKAVSFNAIKNLAFEILYSNVDIETVMHKLEKIFMLNLVIKRRDRYMPRKKISDTKSLNYQKRIRKHVF